jgi:3-oxoacyl-[acyl-carrier protein] reductase
MDLGLKGKCAIVCAASKGLGRASALALAREGASIVMCARHSEALEQAVRDIRAETGATAIAIPADVAVQGDCERVIRTAADALGGIDILVTNTGGPPSGPFERIQDTDWYAAIDSLLMSVIRLSRGVIPHMRQRGGGRIINITSISVKQPVQGLVLSNALRAAVTGLSKTLSNELAADRILVNCVAPGYTATDRVVELSAATAQREGIAPEVVQKRTEEKIPMRRMGSPEEFGAAVAFLASDRASYVTGITLQVDGGYVAGLI